MTPTSSSTASRFRITSISLSTAGGHRDLKECHYCNEESFHVSRPLLTSPPIPPSPLNTKGKIGKKHAENTRMISPSPLFDNEMRFRAIFIPTRLQVYTFRVPACGCAASLSSTYCHVRPGYPLAGGAPRFRLGLHLECKLVLVLDDHPRPNWPILSASLLTAPLDRNSLISSGDPMKMALAWQAASQAAFLPSWSRSTQRSHNASFPFSS